MSEYCYICSGCGLWKEECICSKIAFEEIKRFRFKSKLELLNEELIL